MTGLTSCNHIVSIAALTIRFSPVYQAVRPRGNWGYILALKPPHLGKGTLPPLQKPAIFYVIGCNGETQVSGSRP